MASVEVRQFVERLAGGALDTITVARMANGRDSLGLEDPKVRELAHYIAVGTISHLISEAEQAGTGEALGEVAQGISARWAEEAKR